jgi:hypothetical protein
MFETMAQMQVAIDELRNELSIERGRVAIRASLHDNRTLFLRIGCGEAADRRGRKWELATNCGDGSPIIRLPDGRWVSFPWKALIEAANRAAEVTP